MKFPDMNRKFRNKIYRIIHVRFATGDYDGANGAKAKALVEVKKLRDAGFSARVQKETIVRYPKKGPEVVFNVCARKDGSTLDQVAYDAMGVLGIRPYGYGQGR